MGTRVYVGRLPYDVRERDIEKFFRGYGRIREVLIKDGFAFVVSIFLFLSLSLSCLLACSSVYCLFVDARSFDAPTLVVMIKLMCNHLWVSIRINCCVFLCFL